MPPVTKLISGELSACCHPSHSIELNWFADAAQGAACGAVYLSPAGSSGIGRERAGNAPLRPQL